MVESLDMLRLVSRAAGERRAVAWRSGKPLTAQAFVRRVGAWRERLESSGAAFALYHTDAVEFAAALFGGWHGSKKIYLPADNLPGTCEGLHSKVDGYLGEFEPVWNPVNLPEECGTDGATDFARLDGDFPGLVLYTSGTTGAAQPIEKKLTQMAAEVSTLEATFGALLGTAEILSTVSHQHIYGLLFNVLWPLTAGRALHARTLAFIEELATVDRECALVSSPAHLKRLPESPLWASIAKRLRAVFSSGGPLPLEVAQETRRLLGHMPMEVYGSSETGGIAWRRQHAESGIAWTPFCGADWRIDPTERVLEVRSPNLPDREWFRTADLATSVADGQFILNGRIDRIAKIEGKRISLKAIEGLLSSSPLVSSVRALALEGARQRIAVFIVPSDEGRCRLASCGRRGVNRVLRALLSNSIEPVALPRLWRYLDALPTNAQGKITHLALMASLEREPAVQTTPCRRLVQKSAHRAVFQLTGPSNLLYFDGHFPGQPILPGVVQLDWVIRIGRECFELPAEFRAVRALKFRRVIPPNLPFTLELDYRPDTGMLDFKILSDFGNHASGRVVFGPADV
ncbi:MAG TPA: AMP-binding protein [Pseudolabrys sp.]|nr:AMP-binding protein [Pseudolabrys sp.]